MATVATIQVGGAVVRHRLKRQIREIYRRWGKRRQLVSCDILVHVKPAARQAEFAELQREIHRLLRPLVRNQSRAG